MRRCPKCGLEFPPHVSTCPRDGTPIGPPPSQSSQPPQRKPTPRPSAPAAPSPPDTNRSPSVPIDAEPIDSGSSIRAWIGVLAASLVLFVAYGFLRERLHGPPPTDEASVESSDARDAKPTKRSAKRRKRGGSRAGQPAIEDGSNDDFVIDDREFGDLIAEGEAERAFRAEQGQLREPEPFDPPPEMFQPDGAYTPVASYAEPGARDDVVTLDLSSGDDSGPLKESAVKSVLRVSALMPCYDPVVQKVPQMRGRVRIRFVIAPDGHVMEATVTDSQLRSRQVESCIVSTAKRWRFPRASQKTKFSTHFDFSSR